MVDYAKAIKRPFTDFGKLVIGILLSILPIVSFIASGYALECAKTASKKKYELPKWENILGLFVKGVLIFVIGLIYFIPAIIFMLTGGIGIASSLVSGEATNLGRLFFTSGPLMIVSFFLFLIGIYLLPIAIVNYGTKNKFGKAFELKAVFEKVFSGKYALSWLVVMVYSMVITMIIGFIPFVGGAIGSFVSAVTGFTIFGAVYSETK